MPAEKVVPLVGFYAIKFVPTTWYLMIFFLVLQCMPAHI